MKQRWRDRWRGERSITCFMNFSVVSASVKKMLRYIYEITLVYSFELVTSLKIYKFFSNLLLVVIFSCLFGCCGKTILIFFFGDPVFVYLDKFFLAAQIVPRYLFFLSVCSTYVNFLTKCNSPWHQCIVIK